MATRNFAYDHPAYTQVHASSALSAASGSQNACRFAAFTNMLAKSATFTVVTAGTSAGHLFSVNRVSGTTTTAIGTVTLSTNVAGYTTNMTCNNTTLAQGDVLMVRSGTDATGIAVVTWELQVAPGANLTE